MKNIKKFLKLIITVFLWNIMMIWIIWTVYAINYPTNLSTSMTSWESLTSAMWNDITNAVNKYSKYWVDSAWKNWQVWTSYWSWKGRWKNLTSNAKNED